MSAIVIRVVMIASLTDSHRDDPKPAKPITEPKALIPAKRSADHSGRRKYTPARMRTTQRQTVALLTRGDDLRDLLSPSWATAATWRPFAGARRRSASRSR